MSEEVAVGNKEIVKKEAKIWNGPGALHLHVKSSGRGPLQVIRANYEYY